MIYYSDDPKSMHDYLRSLANRELFEANYLYIKRKNKMNTEFMQQLDRLLKESRN